MKLPLEIENRLDEISQRVGSLGAELVEVTYRRSGRSALITLIVDKAGGITLEECAQINRRIGDYLDRFEEPGGPYTLEVNSPGLDRPLKTERDFVRAVGESVRFFYQEPDGRVSRCTGRVLEADQETVRFVCPNNPGTVAVKLDAILKAVRDIKV